MTKTDPKCQGGNLISHRHRMVLKRSRTNAYTSELPSSPVKYSIIICLSKDCSSCEPMFNPDSRATYLRLPLSVENVTKLVVALETPYGSIARDINLNP